MTKLLKYVGNSLGLTAEWLLILFIAFAFAIRTPSFQTFLAKQMASYLSAELQTKIEIDKVDIVFFDRVSIEGFTLMDQKNDTLVNTPRLLVTLKDFDIDKNSFDLSEIKLENGTVKVTKDIKGIMNYQFLVDYFSSDEPSTAPPLKLSIERINLQEVDFQYNDEISKPLTFGFDFNHMKLTNVSANLSSLSIKDEDISLQVDKLTLSEKSGFKLNEFTSAVKIGPKGISLDKLVIALPESNIKASHIKLNYESWSSFDHFEDSVYLDASFQSSFVSLKDLSLWVPSLEGMDDIVTLKFDIKDKLAGLNISNVEARVFNQTFIRGNFRLPDFRNENLENFSSNITASYIDLSEISRIKFPKDVKKFDFDELREMLGFIELKGVECRGSKKRIFFKANELNTASGHISVAKGIEFTDLGGKYAISPVIQNDGNILELVDVNMSKLASNESLGLVNGRIGFDAINFSEGAAFNIENFIGDISSLYFQGYNYHNIQITAPSINESNFLGKIEVSDPNLQVILTGDARYSGMQQYKINMDLMHAHLSKLGFVEDDSIQVAANITLNATGKDFQNMEGSLFTTSSKVSQGKKSIDIPVFDLKINRKNGSDNFILNSDVISSSIQGKIDYNTVIQHFIEDISVVFPSLNVSKTKALRLKESDVKFDINVGEVNELLSLFIPELTIDNGTNFKGSYNSQKKEVNISMSSDLLSFENIVLKGVDMRQSISSSGIEGNAKISIFNYDSIEFDNLSFSNIGKNGLLESRLTWDIKGSDNSELAWTTMVVDQSDLRFTIKPSFFSLKNYRWEITEESHLAVASNSLNIDTLSLKRDSQGVKMYGCISNNDYDKLNLEVNNLNLHEMSELLQSDIKIEGALSGLTSVSNPYSNLIIESDAVIDSLFVDGEEVGKLFISPKIVAKQDKIDLSGALLYKGIRTFNFGGNYSIPTEKLNVYLNFDKTDIRFANAFLDPELVSDINGKLNGLVYVTGNISNPQLAGRLNLTNGSALVGLTGVKYRINGPIAIKKDVFEINYIPVLDDEGNEARLTATVNHQNFSNFNYEVQLDFENDLKGVNNLNRFMVLNTKYKEGESYYGKAYGKGTLNISGSDEIVDIAVNIQTKKGTSINFPMYGAEEFEEDDDFISFVKSDIEQKVKQIASTNSGVNLDMNFIVNTDAEMKLIFDNNTGDQIQARGFGSLNLKLDPFYNLSLTGKYEISEGSKYDFALGNFKQPFDIVSGSTIKWNGDILDAELNIRTSITMKRVSLLELSPELTDKTLAAQDVVCYLNLKERLLQPAISFNIEAPKAPETGKALVRKISEDQDELNRQFFSLLLVKKFQPIKGSVTARGSAALDMLETQINDVLGKISGKYNLNVNYGKDQTLNETSIGFGMKTQFLKDRLIVSGTFGVGGISGGETSNSATTNNIIGDVNVEYLVNEKGTFRVNAFNESSNSSTNATTADNASGLYTQGVGLSYHEDFQNWKEFMLLQYGLDLFRKEKKYWKKNPEKPSRKVPVGDKVIGSKDIIQEKKIN